MEFSEKFMLPHIHLIQSINIYENTTKLKCQSGASDYFCLITDFIKE